MSIRLPFLLALAAAWPMLPAPAPAATLALADSFRIGNAGVLCTAQARSADPALASLFDRGYQIVCRDAAAPVGRLYALRADKADPAARLGDACGTPGQGDIGELPGASVSRCDRDGLAISRYQLRKGNTLYVADGLSGYASALRLGLRSLVADASVAGAVDVAVTEAGDPAAFARVQAGSLDPSQALSEAYLRNNAASFAESAEFFDLLVERNRQGSPGFTRGAEYLANQGLQQSNLGRFDEADRLFAAATQVLDATDPMASRLLRNGLAMHELNRRQPAAALAVLTRPMTGSISAAAIARVGAGFIDAPLSQRLNTDDAAMRGLSGRTATLTPEERMAILDAQGDYLRGAALVQSGRPAEAQPLLIRADSQMANVRGGRVRSIDWLRAATLEELAGVQERAGDIARARTSQTTAVGLVARQFPDSAALLAARARLAALEARAGNAEVAATSFRAIVKAAPETPGAGQVLRPLLTNWFGLLARSGDANAARDFFDASQILIRPGVAQTQAVLARELSGGSDAASSLFRQSLSLSRDIVRADADIARLSALETPAPDTPAQLLQLRSRREALGREQTNVLAQLAAFPRYRSISNTSISLKDLQDVLKTGEAYYKLVLVGDAAYALFARNGDARVFPVAASTAQLGQMVKALRDTTVIFENGRPTTYPFDAATARKLYLAMFQPVDSIMPQVTHLVFEPDGALLQLPANLLIMADTGLADYQKRQDDPNADPFDMRGIAWLGRDRMVSTATGPKAFIDVRALVGSRASRGYLGLGQNAIPPGARPDGRFDAAAAQTPIPPRGDCDWPLAEWGKPIAAAELALGAQLIGGSNPEVITGAAFSDTALKAKTNLKDFRVIHFATHGLVTAPRPQCPARPALLTSFGGPGSTGLLTFRDIFDLALDADTIILSACDTAGAASAAATREAGITTGGNFALDGLVRAFVGAGARAVVASHWPVPDGFDATKTLITGLFADEGKIAVGEALRRSQARMMDVADTSHPYYWSGFAIIGDAAKPLSKAP
ncbi:MAG: CHAT domain-containing protein [Sphingomonadales bacterium]|jgi:CHAT domain-containing protein